jgi:hypothetical protein
MYCKVSSAVRRYTSNDGLRWAVRFIYAWNEQRNVTEWQEWLHTGNSLSDSSESPPQGVALPGAGTSNYLFKLFLAPPGLLHWDVCAEGTVLLGPLPVIGIAMAFVGHVMFTLAF